MIRTLDARNAPVIDDSFPDASLEMRRGWEAAIAAVLTLAAHPTPPPPLDALRVGRCAAQAETARHGWVQCVKPPFHEDRHVWGDDNQVTPAEPFA